MRRLLSALLALLLLAALPLTAAAGDLPQLIRDEADLLTAAEEQQLFQVLDRCGGTDFFVLTVDSLDGSSAERYAESYADQNGIGILLLVCMDEREWWITTRGAYISMVDYDTIGHIADDFLPCLSDGEYYDAFVIFAEGCEAAVDAYQENPTETVDRGGMKTFLICLVIGLVLALIVVGVMAFQLKSVRWQVSAGSYVKSGSMQLTHSRDIFLYQNTTRRAKPQSGSSGGGGGRSHGGRGGRF